MKIETYEEFLKRGGKVTKLPPENYVPTKRYKQTQTASYIDYLERKPAKKKNKA